MMPMSTYYLPVPSGGVVRVRKLHLAERLQEGIGFALLAAAIEQVSTDDTLPLSRSPGLDQVKRVERICGQVLLDSFGVEDLPWLDQLAVYNWAISDDEGRARRIGSREPQALDFVPFVKSRTAILLDAVCARYHTTPTAVLGLDGAPFACDLDLAIGFRGIRHKADGNSGEVEVQDGWGNTLKVPASALVPPPERGARLMNPDAYARGLKPGEQISLSAGGGDGRVDVMGRGYH